MNEQRRLHAAVVCGNTVYMMGGYGGGNKLDSCEAYDIAKDEWSNVTPMKIKMRSFAATVVNNQYIYTFGGLDEKNLAIDSI